MPTPKVMRALALDLDGALRYPDLSGFEPFRRTRMRCLTCGSTGERESLWVFEHLAGHPVRCESEGCDRVFTRRTLLSSHAVRAHPEEFWVEGETPKERARRLRGESRARLKAAGLDEVTPESREANVEHKRRHDARRRQRRQAEAEAA